MPSFSLVSQNKLATAHVDLQILFNEVIKHCDCTVLEGFRDKNHQERAFAAGNTKLHYPNGKHNKSPSMAVDVAPYPVDWKKTNNFIYFAGFVMGIAAKLRADGIITHTLRWGGAWDGKLNTGDVLNDLVHFELIV